MTSELLGHEAMLEDAMNSVSYVRIGGKIRYFGQKGNAFLLSDEPPIITAQSMPDLSKVSSKESLTGESSDDYHDDDDDDDDTDSITSSTSSIVESNTALSAHSSLTSSSSQSSSSSPCSSSASTPTGRRSPASPRPRTPTTPSPMEVGLPLRLPRPPAAHLPPPLPKRAPSGPPRTSSRKLSTAHISDSCSLPSFSRSNSPSSARNSQRSKNKQNNNNTDNDNDEHSNNIKMYRSQSLSLTTDTNTVTKHPIVSSPTFFRSSGTLTVSILRDLSPRSDGQLSPTPPQTPPTPTSSSSMTSSALVHLTRPFSSLMQSTMGMAGAVAMDTNTHNSNNNDKNKNNNNNNNNSASSKNARPVRSGNRTFEASAGAGVNGEPLTSDQGGQRPATPDSGIDCQLESKSLESKGRLPSLDASSADHKARSILPPELSSLCKGSMTVADLVAGAIVSYRNKPRDMRKGTSSTPKQQKPPPTHHHHHQQQQQQQQQQQYTYSSTQSTSQTGDNLPKTSSSAAASAGTSPSPTSKHKSKKNKKNVREGDSENTSGSLDDDNLDDVRGVAMETGLNGSVNDGKGKRRAVLKEKFSSKFSFRRNANNTAQILTDDNNRQAGSGERDDGGRTAMVESEKNRRESSGNIRQTSKNGHLNKETTTRESRATKRKAQVRPRYEKGPVCGHCRRSFGIRTSRHHCRRCWRSFCEKCLPIQRVDPCDPHDDTSAMSRMCSSCGLEHAMENSRGRTRGLWSEFESLRKEARDNKGLEVTSKVTKDDQQQTIHDLTLLLRKVCVTFLVELQQQLERSRTKTTSRLWDSTPGKNNKGNKVKIKDPNKTCTACQRPLRYLTESRDCAVCGLHFCVSCVARTLQLYLPRGTKMGDGVGLNDIRFYIKLEEFDEVRDTEVSETYYTCVECEDSADRFLRMLEFNQTIPDLETEMFDLQRHIDHALTYTPLPLSRQRTMSVVNLSRLDDMNIQDSNIKLAHRLYDRYLKLYGVLDKIKPATGLQMVLHRHIKQAMYTFYEARRQQLQDILRRRGSLVQVAEFSRR